MCGGQLVLAKQTSHKEPLGKSRVESSWSKDIQRSRRARRVSMKNGYCNFLHDMRRVNQWTPLNLTYITILKMLWFGGPRIDTDWDIIIALMPSFWTSKLPRWTMLDGSPGCSVSKSWNGRKIRNGKGRNGSNIFKPFARYTPPPIPQSSMLTGVPETVGRNGRN